MSAHALPGEAARLREAFDESFAREPAPPAVEQEDLLVVDVGGDEYALRCREIARLVADRPIVPTPAAMPALIGIAGVRGEIVPVFSLRSLLGYPPSAAPRWFVVAAGPQPAGLAFDRLEGHVRVARESLAPAPTANREGNPRQLRVSVATARGARPVLEIGSLLRDIALSLPTGAQPQGASE